VRVCVKVYGRCVTRVLGFSSNCVCVCVCERETLCVWVSVWVRVCMRVRERVCMCQCMIVVQKKLRALLPLLATLCVCACVWERECVCACVWVSECVCMCVRVSVWLLYDCIVKRGDKTWCDRDKTWCDRHQSIHMIWYTWVREEIDKDVTRVDTHDLYVMSVIIHITYMSSPTCPVYHLTRNITRGDTHGGDTHHLHDVVYLFSSQDVTQIDTHHLHDMSERVDDVSTWYHASITTYTWQGDRHHVTRVDTHHLHDMIDMSQRVDHVSTWYHSSITAYTWRDQTHCHLYLLIRVMTWFIRITLIHCRLYLFIHMSQYTWPQWHDIHMTRVNTLSSLSPFSLVMCM